MKRSSPASIRRCGRPSMKKNRSSSSRTCSSRPANSFASRRGLHLSQRDARKILRHSRRQRTAMAEAGRREKIRSRRIFACASVQAKRRRAGTSPVLRGNWVVETLLGEKLPRPPPDVPKLPETESSTNGLTTRQLVEKHVGVESCASVIYGSIRSASPSALRAIGRWRDKESTGLPVDCRAKNEGRDRV